MSDFSRSIWAFVSFVLSSHFTIKRFTVWGTTCVRARTRVAFYSHGIRFMCIYNRNDSHNWHGGKQRNYSSEFVTRSGLAIASGTAVFRIRRKRKCAKCNPLLWIGQIGSEHVVRGRKRQHITIHHRSISQHAISEVRH